MKILIVDDNSKIREMMRSFLQDITDEFHECSDGSEAVGAYRSFQPDWVLMDWQMEQMDGLRATQEIIGSFPDARILMFTQYDDPELRAAAREAGALGFVLKDEFSALKEIVAA